MPGVIVDVSNDVSSHLELHLRATQNHGLLPKPWLTAAIWWKPGVLS